MTLPLPNLDDRRWADLVDEGKALLPLYAPTWTDHNVHDPGITLIELLAAIAEMDLYRVNRVPDEHRRRFLGLVGHLPLPPAGARTTISFGLSAGSTPVQLPAGTELAAAGIPFRTEHDLTVHELALTALQIETDGELADASAALTAGRPFQPLGADPRPGSALYLGFDGALPAGAPLTLRFEAGEPPADASAAEPDGEPRRHHSARIVWEICVGPDVWHALGDGELFDETRALSVPGRVVVQSSVASFAVRLGALDEELYYLRCRHAAGIYDAPPLVSGPFAHAVAAVQEVPARATAWRLRAASAVFGPAPVSGEPSRFTAVFDGAGDVVELSFGAAGAPEVRVLGYVAPQASAAGELVFEALELATGAGGPSLAVDLPLAPVAGGELAFYTTETDATSGAPGWRAWTLRDSFEASTRADAHVRLDATKGRVTFGDGERGLAAPADERILAVYRATRGAAEALDADTAFELEDTLHNRLVVPDLDEARARLVEIGSKVAARGGTPGETLADAAARAFAAVRSSERAVTLADYEAQARATPGVRLARAAALADLHPAFPCYRAPGVVTVIVLPFLPAARPEPSAALLRAVARHLAPRRVLGTRVEVVGPTYVEVGVRARVRARRGVDRASLAARLRAALETFLHPLRGGPAGSGWPFGRDVYRSEVLQVLAETAGADHVLALELLPASGCATCGNVCLPPLGLVAAGPLEIEIA